jgi:hypothetical protein
MKCYETAVAALLGLAFISCGRNNSAQTRAPQAAASSEQLSYHAVFLTNGTILYGKLAKWGTPYPELTDTYYLHTVLDPATKRPHSRLIKRGAEWHGPQRMILNASHILFVEPVGTNSRIAKLIQDAEAGKFADTLQSPALPGSPAP